MRRLTLYSALVVPLSEQELADYLADVRVLVLDEIRRIVPADSAYSGVLYSLMLDYPLRSAKTLRPAICIATSRALGGGLQPVLPSAAVLELYHNAFLIHDDVEDGSEKRRDEPTLHERWGMPIAINVGDGMLALALSPLLENTQLIGLGKALRVLEAVAEMARESAEGQALELNWIRAGRYDESDDAYERMVEKKTSHYSFVTPMVVGAIVAGAEPAHIRQLDRFARLLGAAFQIQDDVLNLQGDEARYGKEIAGDLWEGKLTLALLHALRCATRVERERACAVLRKPRPDQASIRLRSEIGEISALASHIRAPSDPNLGALVKRLGGLVEGLTSQGKTTDDVVFLLELIRRYDSVAHARELALRRAREARGAICEMDGWLKRSVHRSFLEGLVEYVVQRDQ